MRLAQRFQVLAQRLWVTGDVQNVRIRLHHLLSFAVQAAARWVDENRLALVAFQINALQTVKFPHAVHRLGKLFCRHADNLHVIDLVGRNVVLRRRHGRFGNFGRQYAVKVARQRQREVTVATVQLQQVAVGILRSIQRPLQHLNVHRGVRLGEAVLYLTIDHLFARNRQALIDIVLIQRDFSFGCAANQVHVQPLCAQRVTQRFGLFAPLVVEFFVVQQRDHRLIAQGSEVVNLE